ncbi:MAG: glycosyltransferase family A protein, partial [Pseudomonadota bacterium]
TPLVSIVIPTYNMRLNFLRATIASAFAQTYTNIEVIISDNHSTNGTADVLNTFTDPRLRVVRPPTHLPMVPHFQFASAHATGRYISFLCSDDLVTPDWLATLVPRLEAAPAAMFAFGEIANVSHENPDHEVYRCRENLFPDGEYSVADMLQLFVQLNRTSSWLVGDLIRTEAFVQAGGMGQEGIKYSADYALAVRLLEQGGAVYANTLVGKHRNWGARDGKTDAVRTLATIDDTRAIYQLLETSDRLAPLLDKMGDTYLRAKAKRARVLALLLLEGVAMKAVSRSDVEVAADKIMEIDASNGTRRLLALASNRLLGSVVATFHAPLRHLFRRFNSLRRSRQLRAGRVAG